MSFVHTALLYGLALGAVPILIHLLMRRRHKIVRWGAMKYLLAAIEESSRRVQIEDLILLALRVLAVCLLAFALSRPFVGGQKVPPATPRLVVLAVDNSPSMSAKRGGVSRWDLARRWSKELMRQLPSGSAVAIVPMAGAGGLSAGLAEPTRDVGLAGRVLDEMSLSARRAAPAATCRAAAEIVSKSEFINRSVYLVTDFQVNDWIGSGGTAASELKNLLAQEGNAVTAVQCSGGELDNCAAIDLERTLRIIKVDSPAQITGTLTRHAPLEARAAEAVGLTATLMVDGRKADSRTHPLPPNDSRQATFFATLDKDGCHALELRLVPDLCPADDVRYLAVEARDEVRVLCVDGDLHPGEDWLNATYYLKFALSPQIGALSPIAAKVITPAELPQEDLKNYDLVALANVPQIDPTRARDLAAYVRSGRALLVFLGDLVDAASYNATLFGSGPDGLLPAHLGSVTEAPAARPGTSITPGTGAGAAADGGLHVEMKSLAGAVMAFFGNPSNNGGLTDARFAKAMAIDLTAARNTVVHARLMNGLPLLFSADVGEGRIAVMNSTADMGWSNLPPRPAFIPLIQRLVVWLLEPADRCRNLLPGQKYRLALPLSAIHATVTIKQPDARTVSTQPTAVNDRAVVEFADTALPGVYEATWTAPETGSAERRLFAVNIDAAESDLTTLLPSGLRDLTGGAEVAWADAAGGENGGLPGSREKPFGLAQGGGRELWKPILLAGLLALAAETFLGRRFSSSARTSAGGGRRR